MIYPSCGTPSGYSRHVRERTEKCGPCKAAHAANMKKYRHDNGHNTARLIPDTIIKQHGIQVNA
jgi:hypothetical protein